MTVVVLTNASVSPWTVPGDFTASGHTVTLIGPGGSGGTGTVGTSGTAGGGGGGGGLYQGTYASGAIPTTIAFVIPAGGAAASTVWQTASNGQTAGGGGNGAAAGTAGAAGAAGVNVGSPAIVYTLNQGRLGGVGGAGGGVNTLGSGGGGGSAGTAAAGGAGGTPTSTGGGGGGGGGAANAGGSPSTATGGNGGNGTTGAGGTGSGTSGTAGGTGTGSSGGGGGPGAAASSTGGPGGSGTDLNTIPAAGFGGGGGASGRQTAVGAPTANVGGNGGNYGGGGGGAASSRTAGGTLTPGSGAGGVIVVVYTATTLPYAGTGEQRMFSYRYVPDSYWVGTPQAADTLIMQAMAQLAPQEQANLSRIHTVPEPYWMGTPLNADAAIMLAILPLAPIVRAPMYALKPDPYPGLWLGVPRGSVSIVTPSYKPFGAQWEYHYEPDKYWQGKPVGSLTLLTPLPLNAISRAPLWVPRGTDPTNWQQYAWPTNKPLQVVGNPFSNEWASLYSWDSGATGWYWGPTWGPLPALPLTIPKPQPLNKQLWRYDFDVEAPNKWQGSPTPADTLTMLVSGGAPFFKQWRYDFEPDKYWQGAPVPTNIEFFPFIMPFKKQWEYNLEFDKYWLGSPRLSNTVNLSQFVPFANEWVSQYSWDSDVKLWGAVSQPADTMWIHVMGGVPTHQQWRYDLEFDKLWQGSPTPTNIEFFPFVKPFSKQWEYNFDWDKPWQGSPIQSYSINLPSVRPVFKQWHYDFVPAPDWTFTSQPADALYIPSGAPQVARAWHSDYNSGESWWSWAAPRSPTLFSLAVGSKPFAALWRYDLDWDKYWQGSPTPTNIRFFPFVAPSSNEWSSLYTYDSGFTNWLGKPTAPYPGRIPITNPFSNEWTQQYWYDSGFTYWQRYSWPAISLNMLVEGGIPISNEWFIQYTYDQEAWGRWQGTPKTAYSIYLTPIEPPHNEWYKQYEFDSGQTLWQWAGTSAAALTGLAVAGKPFFQQWRYDFVPSPDWEFTSQPSDTLWIHVMGGKPTFKQWRYDFEPDKYWQGQPIQTNIEFFPFVEPFSKLWRWDYDTDVRQWQRYSVPAQALEMLVEGGRPFSKLWRWDLEPDKFWQGSPLSTNIEFFPFVIPFSNEWFQLPWDSGAAFWQGRPLPTSISTIPQLPASTIEWYGQYAWDSGQTFWQGTPITANIRFIPFVVPFANEWSALSAWDSGGSYWQGKPTGPFAPMIALPPPFFKSWSSQYTWDSGATYWQGSPLSVNPRTFPFVFPFSNEWGAWSWDSGATFWQGRPFNLLASGERIPVVPPRNLWGSLYTQDSDLHLWRFSDYVRQNAVATFKFRVFPFSGAYLKETIDIPPFWQGRPLYLPPFLINVAVAVINPDDMLPRFGHPLFPRRKDPLFLRGDDWRKLAIPDEALFPRRKDPLK